MAADDDVLTLGGRQFRPIVRATLGHDFWLLRQIRGSGLSEMVLEPDETAEEFAARTLQQLVEHSTVAAILGGILMPADVPTVEWTEAMALETGRFLLGLSDSSDKAAITAALAATLAALIEGGLITLKRSQPAQEVANAIDA